MAAKQLVNKMGSLAAKMGRRRSLVGYKRRSLAAKNEEMQRHRQQHWDHNFYELCFFQIQNLFFIFLITVMQFKFCIRIRDLPSKIYVLALSYGRQNFKYGMQSSNGYYWIRHRISLLIFVLTSFDGIVVT